VKKTEGEENPIQWSLNPDGGAQPPGLSQNLTTRIPSAKHTQIADQPMGQVIVGNPNQNIMEEDQGSTANAASPSIAIVSQPGQMIEREITADNQIVKQGPPMVGRTDIVHNQVEINQTQAAASTSPMLTGMFSSLLKNQIDKVQRETITKFIVDGLKYLNSPQGNSSDAEIMRHIAIPNSIIQVDLAALGIRSLNININIHPQQGALNAASSLRCTQIIQTADNYQLPPNLQASLTGSQIKTTPTTRVYYRKKFKGKERASDKQIGTVVSENVDNIFAELQDDFVPTNSPHNTDKSKGKETMTKKGEMYHSYIHPETQKKPKIHQDE
jgi:hypothetical protein